MGVLLAFLIVFLVVVAGSGRGGHAAVAGEATKATSILGFSSASEAMSYWQSVLPNAPVPPAILDRFSKPSDERKDIAGNFRSVYSNQFPKGVTMNGRPLEEKVLFPEDIFRPGTVINNLYIDSSATLHTACQSRAAAGYVPMSRKDLTGILNTYAPTSLAMAQDIWSTLNLCEHARRVKGEQQTCTSSINSMVGFAVSVLGTSDLRAFSSSRDVPAEGVTSSSSQRYEMVAVRPVTTAGSRTASTMTCHSMEFPGTGYYCHAINPTKAYEVTLRRKEEEGGAPTAATMRALAVCHLDTSGFDPQMSFFLERGIKPGDATACHFLSRGSVLWVPTAWTQQRP